MAATRELAEETGILADPGELGPVVAESRGRWSAGEVTYDAYDSFFFLRVADLAVETSGQRDLERSLCTGHRWWRVADLPASGEKIYPPGLPALASRLLGGEQPLTPVQTPDIGGAAMAANAAIVGRMADASRPAWCVAR